MVSLRNYFKDKTTSLHIKSYFGMHKEETSSVATTNITTNGNRKMSKKEFHEKHKQEKKELKE